MKDLVSESHWTETSSYYMIVSFSKIVDHTSVYLWSKTLELYVQTKLWKQSSLCLV